MAANNHVNLLRSVSLDTPYTCSICLEETKKGVTHEDGDKITHLFHETCLSNISHCPNCRVPLTRQVTQKTPDDEDSSEVKLLETFYNRYVLQTNTNEDMPSTSRIFMQCDPAIALHEKIKSKIPCLYLYTPKMLKLSNGDEEWRFTKEKPYLEYNFRINSRGQFIGYREIEIHDGGFDNETIGYYFNHEPIIGTPRPKFDA